MIPEVRCGILAAPIDYDRPEEVLKDDLVLQLQKMFTYLLYSCRKAYLPEGWAYAFKDESGVRPVSIVLQQDANEFLQLFYERLESSLSSLDGHAINNARQYEKGNDRPDPVCQGRHAKDESESLIIASNGDSVPMEIVEVDSHEINYFKNLMRRTLGGRLCNQMIKEHATSISDVREQSEDFVCVSLDVKGMHNLESSLSKFVTWEQINGFQWDDSSPRINIIKRQCFSEISDTIIFHLKRFELNFDTFRREKVNDEFMFPLKIDLYPYTRSYLIEKDVLVFGAASSSNYIEERRQIYELTGVVVHTGTTDSGHYYSFIRESVFDAKSPADRRWIEFNDAEVRWFDESRLASECFGGKTTLRCV